MDTSTEELSVAFRAHLLLSTGATVPSEPPATTVAKVPPKEKFKAKDAGKKEEEEPSKAGEKEEETTKKPYERWTLLPEKGVPYGSFASGSYSYVKTKTKAPRYLTTAINYTNGPAHIGHAYEGVTADALSRYHRMVTTLTEKTESDSSSETSKCSCYFVTGADEHGQKIAAAAAAAEPPVAPIDICDKYVTGFRVLNQRLRVSNDRYVRTTEADHVATAQALWRQCASKGDIYLDKYEGWYNVREETFVTETEAAASNFVDATSGKPLKKVEEASYFFRMSKYHDALVEHMEAHPEFVQPSGHRNAVLARLRDDRLRDLSVSRTTFDWGIPVPKDTNVNEDDSSSVKDEHVMYVWFDALSNYLTAVDALGVNDPNDARRPCWPAHTHIIGKDILWFHAVIWPCLLLSAGLPLPKTVFAHGFVNDGNGLKMSKSLGNVVDPHDMLDRYEVDSFRWYLCRAAPYGGELSFQEQGLVDMHNADLADTIGNLVHRVVHLCQAYCGGKVPDIDVDNIDGLPEPPTFAALCQDYVNRMEAYELDAGASLAVKAFRDINGYLTEAAPWHMKSADSETKKKLVIRNCLEAVYVGTHLLLPFLTEGASHIFCKLGTPPNPEAVFETHTDTETPTPLRLLVPGTTIDVGDILYAKVLTEAERQDAEKASKAKADAYAEAQRKKKEKKAAEKAKSLAGNSSEQDEHVNDFTKLDIRVGQITKVWEHPDADRLYCETIDVKDEGGQPREIASGLRQHYTLEQMQDRRVLVVCNLKASKIVGFASHGMVLAAKDPNSDRVELVDPPPDAQVGDRVILPPNDDNKKVPTPFSPAQVKKKKVWEAVAAGLVTDDQGQATWKGLTLMVASGGPPCKVATLCGAPIS